MIAIVSNGGDATADFLEARIREAAKPVVRLNTEHLGRLPVSLSIGEHQEESTFILNEVAHQFSELTGIYYRRPKLPEVPSEFDAGLREWAQNEIRRLWGGLLLGAAGAKWVNHPFAISGASYKPEQLCRARNLGFAVPETIITNDPKAAELFCHEHGWNVIAKPIGHGEIRDSLSEGDDRLIYTNVVSENLRLRFDLVANCPTLFQRHIKKRVDIRATVVERTCIAVALHSQESPTSSTDCRRDNMRGMRYSLVNLPGQVAKKLFTLTESYQLLFAAIDLVMDEDGRYWFLELNPAGQWAWLEQMARAPISSALISSLSS